MTTSKVPWKCPECGALAHAHGKGGADVCEFDQGSRDCAGFVCECPNDEEEDGHGDSWATPCHNANCYHCGWAGVFPKKPGKMPGWADTALKAGWKPPKGWTP